MIGQYGQHEQLPEGVTRDAEGDLIRMVPKFVGHFRADGKPWRSEADGERFEAHDMVPRRCTIPTPANSAGIRTQQKAARTHGLDFLHPQWGWLLCGYKVTVDHPDNLGNGAIKRDRTLTRSPLHPDDAPVPEAEASEMQATDTDQAARRGPGRPRREEHSVA